MTTHGLVQLKEALEQRLTRVSQIRILGTQMDQGKPLYIVAEDAQPPWGTGTTFTIYDNETVGEALARVEERFRTEAKSDLFREKS